MIFIFADWLNLSITSKPIVGDQRNDSWQNDLKTSMKEQDLEIDFQFDLLKFKIKYVL